MFLWRNKKFRKHPYPLVAWTLIFQGGFFAAELSPLLDCYTFDDTIFVRSFGLMPALFNYGVFDGLKKWSSPEWLEYPET